MASSNNLDKNNNNQLALVKSNKLDTNNRYLLSIENSFENKNNNNNDDEISVSDNSNKKIKLKNDNTIENNQLILANQFARNFKQKKITLTNQFFTLSLLEYICNLLNSRDRNLAEHQFQG